MRAAVLEHRLNAACPECGCAQWLHNADGCLKLSRPGTRGANAAKLAPLTKCRCSKTRDDFAEATS